MYRGRMARTRVATRLVHNVIRDNGARRKRTATRIACQRPAKHECVSLCGRCGRRETRRGRTKQLRASAVGGKKEEEKQKKKKKQEREREREREEKRKEGRKEGRRRKKKSASLALAGAYRGAAQIKRSALVAGMLAPRIDVNEHIDDDDDDDDEDDDGKDDEVGSLLAIE